MWALACCTPSVKVVVPAETPSTELSAIDSLMWQQPDSAFVLLQEFAASPKADSLDAFGGHYFQLLLSELLYKNDYAQTNRQELQQAVSYFDSLARQAPPLQMGARGLKHPIPNLTYELFFLVARAHYINGVGYYERDSVVEACKEYLKALETMEGRFEEKEMVGHRARFMSYTHNRLGEMFSEQFMMNTSIVCLKNSLNYYVKSPTLPTGVSRIYNWIGMQYDMIGIKDSALYYYETAMEYLPDTNNLIYRNLVSCSTLLSYQKNHDFLIAINHLYNIVNQTTDESEKIARYLTIGDIFYEEKQFDSAKLYLELVYEYSGNIISKIRAADYLHTIYDYYGEEEKRDVIVCFLANNKKTEAENKSFVSTLNELFQGYMQQKKEKQAKTERAVLIRNMIIKIVFLVFFIGAMAFILVKLKSKKELEEQRNAANKTLEETELRYEKEIRKQQEEVEQTLKCHEDELEAMRATHEKEQEALMQCLQKQEEQVVLLERVLKQQREDAELRREAFLKEAICKKINDSIRSLYITARDGTKTNVTLSEADANELREAVLRHYPNFELVLMSKNPKISYNDLQLCQLYLLGLDERQIAVLQCKTYSAIKKRAIVLKKVMGITDSISAFILNFSASGSI